MRFTSLTVKHHKKTLSLIAVGVSAKVLKLANWQATADCFVKGEKFGQISVNNEISAFSLLHSFFLPYRDDLMI